MAKDGLSNSPFGSPVCPTPSGGDGTVTGQTGGASWPMEDNGKAGLVTSPYQSPVASAPNGKETANSSGLGLLPYTMDVKDGPAQWSAAKVEPGVASPAVPVTNADRR